MIKIIYFKKKKINYQRDKPTTSIAPVIDLSSDRRCKPQLQLRKDDMPISSSPSSSLASSTGHHIAPLNQMPPTAALASSFSSSASYHSSNELRFNTLTGKVNNNKK